MFIIFNKSNRKFWEPKSQHLHMGDWHEKATVSETRTTITPSFFRVKVNALSFCLDDMK